MMNDTSRNARVPVWGGTLLVAHGRALYAGPAGDTRKHRHHALQLTVGLHGPFEADVGFGGPLAPVAGLLIAANACHRIDGRGLPVGIYYVDGSSAEARALSSFLEGRGARVFDREITELRTIVQVTLAQPDPSALGLFGSRVAEVLGCPVSMSREGDPAVRAAAAHLEERLSLPPTAVELADHVGLRQRELSARFRRETGLTIRRYVLWLRLKAAVSSLAEEGTLTEAAHAAGFADAAHLSRTFVETFGVAPSDSVVASRLRVFGPP